MIAYAKFSIRFITRCDDDTFVWRMSPMVPEYESDK